MNTVLHVCLISQEFPPYTQWGGVGVYNNTLAAQLVCRGHKVTVLSRAHLGAPREEFLTSGVRVLRVGMPIQRKYFVGRTIDRILHARAIAKIARKLDAEEHFSVLETTEANLEGEVLLRDVKFRGRILIQCNGSNAFGQVAGGMLRFLHRLDWHWSYLREQRTLRLVSCVVVTSNATRKVLLDHGVRSEKIRLIYQGIDTVLFRPLSTQSCDRIINVGFVGRLESRKGIDFLWKVIESVGPKLGIHFHLKGALHPATLADTKERLNRYKDWVTYYEPTDHSTMPEFYQKLQVLLQPSRFENFGLAYAEAMASGVLVIAGIAGSASEIVKHNSTGFLVDPDGEPDQVVKILFSLRENRQAYHKVCLAARIDVERRFSLASCISSKLALYGGIISDSQENIEK